MTLGLLLSGCAGRAPARPEPAPSAQRAPVALEEAEERLRVGLGIVEDDSAACPDRCQAAEGVCEAADRVCAIVAELRDVTLAPRCDRARAACASGREIVSSCGCAHAPAAP